MICKNSTECNPILECTDILTIGDVGNNDPHIVYFHNVALKRLEGKEITPISNILSVDIPSDGFDIAPNTPYEIWVTDANDELTEFATVSIDSVEYSEGFKVRFITCQDNVVTNTQLTPKA